MQQVAYQPWSLARLVDGVITSLPVVGLEASSPNQVFCNPVVVGDNISFVHGGSIYVADLSVAELSPVKVKSGIFTGFVSEGLVVYALPSCTSKGVFVVGNIEHQSPFDNILRIIPSGDSSLIITGSKAGRLFSILWHDPDNFFTIKANGEDVYKCCIDGMDVIHTVRGEGFEDRQLHRDTLELTHD